MRTRLLGGFFIGEYHVEPSTGIVTNDRRRAHLPPRTIEFLLRLASAPHSLLSREELVSAVSGESESESLHIDIDDTIRQIRAALDDHAEEPKYLQTVAERGYRLLVEPRFTAEPDDADAEPPYEEALPDNRLIHELYRRGVIETGVAYLIVGWLLIQVAAVTFDQLALPSWAASYVTYFVIAGFPIALLLSWFVELTTSGPRLDSDSGTKRRREAFNSKYVSIVAALLVASAGVYMYDRLIGLPGEAIDVAIEEPVAPLPIVVEQSTIAVDQNTIAVLPFFNIDGSEEARIFSAGLAEDVINRLAAIPDLRVSSRGDSFTLAPNSTSQNVRSRLRVAYYLEGSVRISDETLRVVAQLIDSDDGFHVVSRTFESKLADFFDIQDQITDLIVANLRVALPSSTTTLTMPMASNGESFDAYLEFRRGLEILYNPMTKETVAEALATFNRSLSVDRGYAAAHAGICLTYISAYDVTSERTYIDEAERSCASALGLNSNLSVVHNALGDLYGRTGRYEDAERAFQRALAINAHDVQALTGLADVYLREQRVAEAEERYRQAVGLQPGNWNTYNSLGRFLYMNGRYDESADAYREVVSIDPKNINGWTNLATALMLSGDFAAAAPAFERAIELDPVPTTYANQGLLHYYLGETDVAATALETATAMAPSEHLFWSNLGDVRTVAGDLIGANQAFSKAEQLALDQLEINNRNAETITDLAWITAMLGRLEDAQRHIARAEEIGAAEPYVAYISALVLARMGDHAAALDQLETAVELGYPPAIVRAEPHLTMLEGERRFVDLVGN